MHNAQDDTKATMPMPKFQNIRHSTIIIKIKQAQANTRTNKQANKQNQTSAAALTSTSAMERRKGARLCYILPGTMHIDPQGEAVVPATN